MRYPPPAPEGVIAAARVLGSGLVCDAALESRPGAGLDRPHGGGATRGAHPGARDDSLMVPRIGLDSALHDPRLAEDAVLAASRLAQVLEATGSLLWTAEPATLRVLSVQGDPGPLFGRPLRTASVPSSSLLDAVHPEDRPHVRQALTEHATWMGGGLACRVVRADGSVRWAHSTITPIVDAAGTLVRIDGISTDITERIERESKLRASRQRLELVLKGANDGWWDWDLLTDDVYLSPRWYAMVGLDAEVHPPTAELLLDRIHPDDRPGVDAVLAMLLTGARASFDLEYRLRHADGHHVPVRSRGVVLQDPDPIRIAGSNVDLTAHKRAEARQAALYRDLQRANADLQRQATIDGLTGVANRRRFDAFLDQVWTRAQVDQLPVGLLLCDVDHFKVFNDHHGHPEGDRCLVAVAGAIAASVRDVGDLVARYGGEEFAIVLPGTLPADVVAVAERIRADLAALALPHPHSPVAPRVTLSIGVACVRPTPDEWAQSLITRADDALLRAKRTGRDRIELDPALAAELDPALAAALAAEPRPLGPAAEATPV